jgi:hypothetical protein
VNVDGERGGRLGTFLIGGVVGSIAGLVAAGRMRMKEPQGRTTPAGLAAFEEAPCFQELVDQEREREEPASR